MALFCMIFGIVIFVAFLLGGYVFATMFAAQGLWNTLNGYEEFQWNLLFQLPTAENAGTYVACILIMGFLGLMIGMGVFMNGLIYKRLDTLERLSRRRIRLAQREE